MEIPVFATIIGCLAAALLLIMLIWSIAVPGKRLWPPKKSTRAHKIVVWTLTAMLFASAFVLGIADWNYFQWPAWLRWGFGLPLIVIGNWVVWRCALELGMQATSGAAGTLKTHGFFRYSRNPQYVADIAIFLGWAVLSGSLLTLPIVGAAVLNLLIAPFAEEPWLRRVYGDPYDQYRKRTRRYL